MTASDIDDVILQLTGIVEDARRDGDRNGYFALLYRHVTEMIKKSIDAGEFDDGPRMNRFDTAFGNRYFVEFDTWHAGGRNSGCWKEAFSLAAEKHGAIIQHMLLGVNAHINLDLAIAAADVSPGPLIHDLERDFFEINRILWQALLNVQDSLGEVSPCMQLLDIVGGRTDELLLDFSIRIARKEAWEHAVLLANQSGQERDETISRLDSRASLLARILSHPAGLLRPALELIEGTESQDTSQVISILSGRLHPTAH